MNKVLLASASIALALGGVSAADATVTNTFAQGVMGFQAGDTPIADFDTTFGGAVLTGAGTGYYTGNTPNLVAAPAGDTTHYLAVLNGGSASFSFTSAQMISFDVGSVDDFNSVTLTLLGTGGPVTLSGSQINKNAATGSQTSTLTNGRLTITGTAGEVFTGLRLSSTGNSFEVDNLATSGAVPEAATWAMMLVGFGGIGGALRSTRRRTAVQFG